jgi:peptidoglycan/LPS O-acetylase OafA/YrhL
LRPIAWAGRRCYALYLFHGLVIDQLIERGYANAAYIALPVVCILAEISWRFIEAPLIDHAKKRVAADSQAIGIAKATAAASTSL